MNVREYQLEDRPKVEVLIAELQDYEARYVPGMRPGKEMAADYLEKAILKDCQEKEGKIFVAEESNKNIVGFTWVWIENEPRDLVYLKPVYTFVCIGDYIVSEEYRNQGIGKALLEKVAEYAKEKGINQIKLHVSSLNKLAREIYRNLGFEEDEVTLVKKL